MIAHPPELGLAMKLAAVVVRTTPLRYVGLALAQAGLSRAAVSARRRLDRATALADGMGASPWIAALAFAATLASTGPAGAQTAPRAITLDEAVAMALKNAPQIVQVQGQVRTSAAGVRSGFAAFLPNLSVSAGATRQLPAGQRTRVENGQVITLPEQPWSSSIGMGANVELFDGGRRFFDLREARARSPDAGARRWCVAGAGDQRTDGSGRPR